MGVVVPLVSAAVTGAAAVYGAKKSASANTAATKMQTDSANRTAELQLIAQREAADQEAAAQAKSQAFLEKQWAIGQENMAPYMGLGSGAVTNLKAFMGLPSGSTGSSSTSLPVSADATKAPSSVIPSTQYTDPTFVEGKIAEGFQQAYGRTPTTEEMSYWKGKMLTPDTFSDNKVRVGWNPYWQARLTTPGSASADVGLAGDETVIGTGQSSTGSSGAVASKLPLITSLKDLKLDTGDTTTSTTGVPKTTANALNGPVSGAGLATGSGLSNERMVWMVAPDGSVNRVKSSLVPKYMAKGAQVLQA